MEELLVRRRSALGPRYNPTALSGVVEKMTDLCREKFVPLPLRAALGRCL